MLTLCLRYPPLYGCPRTAVLTSDTQEWELQLDRGWGGAGLSCGCWMQGELWNYIYHHAPTDERDGWMGKKWSSGGKDT